MLFETVVRLYWFYMYVCPPTWIYGYHMGWVGIEWMEALEQVASLPVNVTG